MKNIFEEVMLNLMQILNVNFFSLIKKIVFEILIINYY